MRPTFRLYTLAAAMLACLVPAQARAQVTFAALAPRLPVGHRTVLTLDGRPLTGELVRATADGLVFLRYDTGATEEVAAARLSSVTYDDRAWDGAAGGFALGALPGLALGLFARTYCHNEGGGRCDDKPYVFTAVTGGLGALLGAVIDSERPTTVRFVPAPAPKASFNLAVRPDRRRPMALVSIAF